MKLKLDTKALADPRLKPGQSETFAWDTELAGFGLRRQGECRTYVAQYRAGGRTRRVTIGSTDRLTPTQAREGARKILARVSLGEDPQDEKAAQRAAAERTFAKVVDVYLADKQRTLRPSSFKVARLYLTGSYFRPLHAMGINEITHPDIAARLSAHHPRAQHAYRGSRQASHLCPVPLVHGGGLGAGQSSGRYP